MYQLNEKDNPFPEVTPLSKVALNILKKRYFAVGETTWEEVVDRVCDYVCFGDTLTHKMILNRYFVPNSPCLVNAGRPNGGLAACFVVDFPDNLEGIIKTKGDFMRIAKKGGGCGTTLTKLRPEGANVAGSSHGYAGGPIKFYNTICNDMKAMTQAGFREMAMMGTMSVYHPDIIKFITAKAEEGVMATTNISVVVDDDFMQKVIDDEEYQTYFDYEADEGGMVHREFFNTYPAREIFNLIVNNAWLNGEPGLLFYDSINLNTPYKYSNQEILATNPCGEQPLPPNGVCNLGNLDVSKFLTDDKSLNLELLELAVRLGIRFLDSVIEKTKYPTEDIYNWAMANRPVGLGIMGLADYYLIRGVAYGSSQALEELTFILNFIKSIAEDESITLGEERGIPTECEKLPVPRRNITLLSIAPTGTTSLIAGCNNSIEPIFSEITIRNDKTGTYRFHNVSYDLPHFRCAVSANGATEVTWEEHVVTQATAQRLVDSGVSKTINFPSHTRRETIYNAFMLAWELGCKGITVYRNGSRQVEVLSPKNLKRDKCPVCGSEMTEMKRIIKCSNSECGFSTKKRE